MIEFENDGAAATAVEMYDGGTFEGTTIRVERQEEDDAANAGRTATVVGEEAFLERAGRKRSIHDLDADDVDEDLLLDIKRRRS
jgi:hypothetical protein